MLISCTYDCTFQHQLQRQPAVLARRAHVHPQHLANQDNRLNWQATSGTLVLHRINCDTKI